jgi:hypothetical protein
MKNGFRSPMLMMLIFFGINVVRLWMTKIEKKNSPLGKNHILKMMTLKMRMIARMNIVVFILCFLIFY